MKIFYESETISEKPPIPFLYWDESALKKRLKIAGFDFSKPIIRIDDPEKGVYWQQGKK